MKNKWTSIDFDNEEKLLDSIQDRDRRVLFYPAVGQMKTGEMVDLDISISPDNVFFPMRAMVIGRRTRPRGPANPSGIFLEVIEEDARRFDRLCAFAEGNWKPSKRRTSPRLRSMMPVTYYLDKSYHQGMAMDICSEGMFIQTNGMLPEIGHGIYVRMPTSPLWIPIRLSTRVCWIDPVDSRRGMGLYCFGSRWHLKRLRSMLHRLKSKKRISLR